MVLNFAKKNRWVYPVLMWALLVLPSQAQNNAASPKGKATQAENAGNNAIMAGQYKEAIPHIQQVLAYIATIEDPELQAEIDQKVETLKFLMAFCYVASGDYAPAIEKLNAFVTTYPKSASRQKAYMLLAYCQNIQGLTGEETKTLEYILATFRVPKAERLELTLSLGALYYKSEDFEKAFKAFRLVMARAEDPSLRMAAVSHMLDTLLKLEDADLLYQLVPTLKGNASPAKYSLQFNMKAIEAADRLTQAGNHSPALVLLKLCKPAEEIKAGLQLVKRSLERRQASLARMKNGAMNSLYQIFAVENRLNVVKAEIDAAEELVDYDEGLHFRVAKVLFEMGLYYESYQAYVALLEDFPESENIPNALYGTATLATRLGLREKALQHGTELITQFPKSSLAAETALNMAYVYQAGGEFEKEYAHLMEAIQRGNFAGNEASLGHAWYLAGYSRLYLDDFEGAVTNFNKMPGVSRYTRDATYWRAYIELFSDNYPEAVIKFKAFLAKYQQGAYTEDASYRLALASFGMGDIETTRTRAEQFIKKYPNSLLRGEAHNLLGDVYGTLGLLDEAIDAYGLVELFTDRSDQVHAAAFNAARVMEADSRWTQVVDHFQRYLNRYGEDGRYTMAVYKMGEAYQNLGRSEETLELFWKTFQRFANDPQELGTDPMLGRYVTEFQQSYIDKVSSEKAAERKALREEKAAAESEIERTEEEMKIVQKAEAEIEAKLAKRVYDRAEGDVKRQIVRKLTNQLRETSKSGDQETKRVRLLYGLAIAGDMSNIPSKFSEAQVAAGTPVTLEWMGRFLLEQEDYELAEMAYRRIINDFPETDATVKAYVALGNLALSQGKKDKAFNYFETVYDLYPTSEKAGIAFMGMADIQFENKQFAQAAERYEQVMMVREWRGPMWPEALYKLGRCTLEQGEAEKAFAFFQRVYVLYAHYGQWTVKAYLDSGHCLEKLGRLTEAYRTYEEMLATNDFAATPEGREAEARMKKLPVPPVIEESTDEV